MVNREDIPKSTREKILLEEFSYLLYQTAEEDVSVRALIQDETIWLTQKSMAELFGVESHTIAYHLRGIYKTEELTEEATTRKIRAVQQPCRIYSACAF